MTIIEAIRGGKKFKRRDWHSDHGYHSSSLNIYLSIRDILADDWEIEEETIQISKRQLEAAFHTMLKQGADVSCNQWISWDPLKSKNPYLVCLEKELGFRQDSSKEEGK